MLWDIEPRNRSRTDGASWPAPWPTSTSIPTMTQAPAGMDPNWRNRRRPVGAETSRTTPSSICCARAASGNRCLRPSMCPASAHRPLPGVGEGGGLCPPVAGGAAGLMPSNEWQAMDGAMTNSGGVKRSADRRRGHSPGWPWPAPTAMNGGDSTALAVPRPDPTDAEAPQHSPTLSGGARPHGARPTSPAGAFHRPGPGSPTYRARRWVVERTHSWLNRFRRLLIRWEKKQANYLGMLHLACAWMTFRAAGVFGYTCSAAQHSSTPMQGIYRHNRRTGGYNKGRKTNNFRNLDRKQ